MAKKAAKSAKSAKSAEVAEAAEGSTDDRILAFIKEVNRQKEEIAKAERPQWKTNQNFSWVEGKPDVIVLHVEKNIKTLVEIAAFLAQKEEAYMHVAADLGVEAPPFTWNGFSVADWLEDIKMRINKVQINSKRAKLEALEERLGKIVSPELRAQMELEAIAAELG